MNELLFFGQVFVIVAFLLYFRRLGIEALYTLCAIFSLIANLFVLKQTTLFGLEVTCSDAFAVGCTLGLSFVQQDAGKKAAQKLIKITFGILIFFTILSQIHLLYTPSLHDTSQGSYSQILTSSPRILVASLISYFISQAIDIEIFGWLRERWIQKRIFLPLLVSCLFTQFIDTCIFSFLGLYGMISPLLDIIIFSFMIKAVVAFLMVTASWLYPVKAHEV